MINKYNNNKNNHNNNNNENIFITGICENISTVINIKRPAVMKFHENIFMVINSKNDKWINDNIIIIII